MLAAYLRSHKRLVIPGLGAFIVKEDGSVVFSELMKRDDGALRAELAGRGMTEIGIAGAIDRFVFEVRHALQTTGRYPVAGVGLFTVDGKGAMRFRYDPAVGGRPSGAAAVSAPAEEPAPAEKPAAPESVPEPRPAGTPSGAAGSESRTLSHPAARPSDPALRGLAYGRPVKTTDAYTYVGSAPRKGVDKFLVIAVLAAVLAVGAIVYGFLIDRQGQLLEEGLAPTEAAVPAGGRQ